MTRYLAPDRILFTDYSVQSFMSTDSGSDGDSPQTPTRITLELSEDGEVWNVRDEDTGVATQGETREEALEMLDDAVALHKGEG